MKTLFRKKQSYKRGFTLLIAVILTSVILSVSFALLDIAYKQIILSSVASQSQVAFYNADGGLECALYWDQQQATFDYATEPVTGTITCQGQTITYTAPPPSSGARTTTFLIPCPGDSTVGDGSANITIFRKSDGTGSIYANGYNSCNAADPRRVERGEKAVYGS